MARSGYVSGRMFRVRRRYPYSGKTSGRFYRYRLSKRK